MSHTLIFQLEKIKHIIEGELNKKCWKHVLFLNSNTQFLTIPPVIQTMIYCVSKVLSMLI